MTTPSEPKSYVTKLNPAAREVVMRVLRLAKDRAPELVQSVQKAIDVVEGHIDITDDGPQCGGVLRCPACKGLGPFQYIEEISCVRDVRAECAVEDSQLFIESHYETDGYDYGDNGRLVCLSPTEGATTCGHEFPVPTDLGLEFI